MGRSSVVSAVVGRFVGREATELSILCRPAEGAGPPGEQAAVVYGELGEVLAAEGASGRDLAHETLFLRDASRDLQPVLAARADALAGGADAGPPAPACIGQPPVAGHAAFELLASAVIPHRVDARTARDVRIAQPCSCAACAGSGARVVRLGPQTSVHTATVHGRRDGDRAEALDMFHEGERLLAACGMGFGDVVRTWIWVRDIQRDYDALNAARREFFRERGVEPRPASTGVQGAPVSEAHDFAMRLWAVRTSEALEAAPMSTSSLNEAWTYGADFSRGMRVVEANGVTLHVSGTASIDEAGRTAHVGDLGAQIDRMLHNIESLLAAEGAGFADVVSGVAYLKHARDVATLRAKCRERGFDGFPCAIVETPLCRPELLCEAEAVAALPLTIPRA